MGEELMLDYLTMQDLRALAPIPGQTVAQQPTSQPAHLLGYYGPGDGGDGVFIWDALSNEADDSGLIIQPAGMAGAGRWRRQFDYVVSVRWFGAYASGNHPGYNRYSRPAGSPNNLAAFTNAIHALTPGGAPLKPAYFGPRIVVPPGLYEMEGTLIIDRSVAIVGTGGYQAMNASWLHFPADIDGVHIYRNLPPPPSPSSPPPPSSPRDREQPRGDFSILEGLQITAPRNGSSGHGIRVDALCSLTNCYVDGFGGNGVHIEARAPASGANLWHMSNVHIYYCDHGLYVDGPDTNAGTCVGISVVSNKGWGIFDRSFLGNTYVGCHAATNRLGSYKSDSADSRSIFLSCYAEKDSGPADIAAPALVIGGHINNLGSGGYIGQLTSGVKTVSPALRVSNPSTPVTVQLGNPKPETRIALEIVSGDDTHPYRLLYDNSDRGERVGWWEWNWADLAGGNALAFCHVKAPEFSEKSPETVKAWLPRGFYVGMPLNPRSSGNDGRVYTTVGNQPPTMGIWSKGDRVLNNDPRPGHATLGCAGWICIEGSGSTLPHGIWVPFGQI
jgi:hypothetical protein